MIGEFVVKVSGMPLTPRPEAVSVVVGPVASNEKGRPEGRPFHRKPAAFAAASRCPQARTSVRTGILVTAAEDRGWWLDTGSPPFSCCDEEPQVTKNAAPPQAIFILNRCVRDAPLSG